MRLTKLLQNKPDKYLEHFLKYNRINHIIQIENEKYCKDKKEEQKDRTTNNKNSEKKDSYPEFHKEGFPWE